MKMNEYLASMKQIADNLALAGEPISDGYLISRVIAELDAEYLPMTCQINASGNMSWQEAHATLMTFEHTLIQLNLINNGSSEIGNVTTNLATHKPAGNSPFYNKNKAPLKPKAKVEAKAREILEEEVVEVMEEVEDSTITICQPIKFVGSLVKELRTVTTDMIVSIWEACQSKTSHLQQLVLPHLIF